jgi:hypothetical protein
MRFKTTALLALIFIGLAAGMTLKAAAAEEGKQIMILVTTDDSGELNPCG